MPALLVNMINTGTKEYYITRLNKQNLADVTKLHTAVYSSAPADNYFPRKYDTAYTGVENVGFIAYNRDRLPVAYYGVIPCFIQYKNETILAAQSADTMTHLQHRYKGMFVELSNMTFDLCRKLGINLIFGFPNQNSYHGAVNKLGWQMTDTMTCFSIPVKTLPLESMVSKASLFGTLYKKYISFLMGKRLLPLQGVSNSVFNDGYAGVCRNDDYLKYRTYNPTQVIKVQHAKVWMRSKFNLVIGDMEGITAANFTIVIDKLKNLAFRMGLKQIQFHCSPGTELHRLFSMNFKAIQSYPMLFQNFGSPIPIEKIRFTFSDIDIF